MKKILVATPYLHSGGVEVSLIRFLKELTKNTELEIDLLLLKKEGIYLKDVPQNVTIKEVSYDNGIYSYERKIKDYKNIKGVNKLKFLFYRIKLKILLSLNNWSGYYKSILKHTNEINEGYDLAIDWHGYGHFMTSVIAEKIKARKKVFWIHDEKNEWLSKIKLWYNNFDKIFCVGVACKNNVNKNFPILSYKTDVFYNMTDFENVRKKSLDKMDFNYDKSKCNIITVGRLEWQKAYDVAVMIAKELKNRKFNFCWYVIGTGHKKEEIENLIKENNIEGEFKLLGVKKNPYPYVKNADLFVLSSRHEGYCLATLEAKILGKVIVATNIESNREQIINGKNGFLCELDPKEFANKIIEVYQDKDKMQEVENNLVKENFDYTSEFEKLYKLMDN